MGHDVLDCGFDVDDATLEEPEVMLVEEYPLRHQYEPKQILADYSRRLGTVTYRTKKSSMKSLLKKRC